MHEQVLIIFVKKYFWHLIATAFCITIVHSALENWWGNKMWVKVSLAVVNSIYASVFFGLIWWYYFNELGIILWILSGSMLGLSSIKEVSEFFKNKIWK